MPCCSVYSNKQETINKEQMYHFSTRNVLKSFSNIQHTSASLKCHLPLCPPPPQPPLPSSNRRKGERAESSELLSLPLPGGAKKRTTFQTTPTPSSLKIGSLFSANLNSRKNLLLERVLKVSENRLG